MNITHDHIRSIVGTEPQEWWPEDVGFHTGVWVDREYYATISPITAYHAFVGAAVEWLQLQAHTKDHYTVLDCATHASTSPVWGVYVRDAASGVDSRCFGESPCLLSALVAAIREVKQ